MTACIGTDHEVQGMAAGQLWLVLVRELAAGPHKLFLQWRRSLARWARLYLAAGAGTSANVRHARPVLGAGGQLRCAKSSSRI